MNREERSWFVCQTNVREERRAKYFLEEKGFEVYLPVMEAQKVVGSRGNIVRKPLFPNYLFVRFREDTDSAIIRWTRGICRILPESIRPVSVENDVVECIMVLADKDGVIRRQSLNREDKVRILSGPFSEIMGIFEEWSSGHGRARILLKFVNYQASMVIHHTLLEKIV